MCTLSPVVIKPKTTRPNRRKDGCTECRRKRIKCDLGLPTCSRCAKYPKGCVYSLRVVRLDSQDFRPFNPVGVDRSGPVQAPRARSNPTPTPATNFNLYQPNLLLSPDLTSSESRFFMHIFSTETALRLFPAAPSLFLQRMISSAVGTPHLLYALLAAACSHHARLVKDDSPQSRVTCLRFTNRAISSLRSSLASPQGMLATETVATALILCTNDVCNGRMDTWRTHLSGVMRLLISLLQQGGYRRRRKEIGATTSDDDDSYVACLVKWFTMMHVMAGSSGHANHCSPETQTMLLRAAGKSSSSAGRRSSSSLDVDRICGYSLDLVPLLSSIAQLAKWRQACDSIAKFESGIQERWLQQMAPRIAQLESQISVLAGRTGDEELVMAGCRHVGELEQTNLAFVHAALLHLHRRVLKLPRDHPKVREDVRNIVDAMRRIPPLSAGNILILWPVFSVGCETEDVGERAFIQDRMGSMQSLGMGNFTRARELLTRYWGADTSLSWDVYFEQQGVELVLF